MINTLNKLRAEIDALDNQILSLINERSKLAVATAKAKRLMDDKSSLYKPDREAKVLHSIINRNNSLLKNKDMARIFREIMSACLALEKEIKVAYLGPEGTFTQEATLKHFGCAVSILPCSDIINIFQQVEKNIVDYGVVPIENSSNGVIGITVDRLYFENLKICGEVEVVIRHQLMMAEKTKEIKIIYAHQQALDQCQYWLHSNYPNVELKSVASNALAAKIVKNEENSAAIATEASLELYNLECVVKNIEDQSNNVTRFLILGKEFIAPSGKDKTSLLITTKHESGALFDLLMPFKEKNINILQITSHPMPGVKWSYLFLIDIEGHQQEEIIQKALKQVSEKVIEVKILGSYPVAVL